MSHEMDDPGVTPIDLIPDDIFSYIYAVLRSPEYRKRYAEFLKIDFPRVPLPGSHELFKELASLGAKLTELHFLESPLLSKPQTKFIGPAKTVIEKVSHADNTVYIDKAQSVGFVGVSNVVFNFHIGGYQVCEKWLKDRKGRALSANDVTHYQKTITALTETIRLMQEIDEVIEEHGGFPDAFAAVTPSAQTGATTTAAKSVTASDQGLSAEDELPLA